MHRNVLVTGCSSGIGEATALHLDQLGYQVLAGVRRPDDAERLAAAASPLLRPVLLDVADETSVARAAAEVRAVVGPAGLHGVVNNAAEAVGGPVEYLPLDDWRHQLEVNLLGPVSVVRHTLPMVRDAGGRIVFVGSIGGRVALPMTAPYNASKFALEAVADSLRQELRPWGIRVVVVEPGAVRTSIRRKGLDQVEQLVARLPAEAVERYGDRFERMRRNLAADDDGPISEPSDAARTIAEALTAAVPRARYQVGRDALVGALAARFLPDRARDALFRRLAELVDRRQGVGSS